MFEDVVARDDIRLSSDIIEVRTHADLTKFFAKKVEIRRGVDFGVPRQLQTRGDKVQQRGLP